jgi:hypothetical protein
MSKTITGRLERLSQHSHSHMVYVIQHEGCDEQQVIIDPSVEVQQRQEWMAKGVIKEMVSIPFGTVVTVLGPPPGHHLGTMEGEHLVMRVRASEALVWNVYNKHWYCDHSVETVMSMRHFNGTL